MPNYVTVLELQRAMKLYPMGRSMARKDLVGPKRVIVTESHLTVRVNESYGDLTSAVLRLRWWSASAVSRESGKGGRSTVRHTGNTFTSHKPTPGSRGMNVDHLKHIL